MYARIGTRIINIVLSLLLSGISLAGEYSVPGSGDDLIGQNYTITIAPRDNLTKIRQQHDVSYDELLEANPQIDFYKLKVGQKVIIPKQFILPKFRKGIVINIPELRLYYFAPDGKHIHTYPVGLGREGWRTPLAATKVVNKTEDPVWRVPNSIRQYVYEKTGEVLPDEVHPGPKNPLGKYALYLNKQGYLIHGTNVPTSVGTFISSGCMRLLREPIETLYEEVPIGTPVHIIHYPYKAGWHNNKLYLESHQPINSYAAQPVSQLNKLNVESVIHDAVHLRPTRISWNTVSKNVNKHLGIPEQIGYVLD
ncbi:MAG: L,D-transpeptidase family protein [Coxiellaceae bacterium]|jgi:L,D-transpeptidase ErfK/SrfK|nr:L,D-transpeptidase family protein [Coxiellaceae bacterium]